MIAARSLTLPICTSDNCNAVPVAGSPACPVHVVPRAPVSVVHFAAIHGTGFLHRAVRMQPYRSAKCGTHRE
jgi:hypothetical protein